MKNIVDVYWDEPITTYNEVVDSTEFVILKASQGTKADSKFLQRAEAFEERKHPYWCYIFLNKGNEIGQVDFWLDYFYSKIKNNKYFIGIILDVESNNNPDNVYSALKYVKSIAQSNHWKFGFYCGFSVLDKYKKSVDFAKNDSRGFLWVARYTKTYTVPEYVDMWQYTEDGECKGFTGSIDLSKPVSNRHSLNWYKKQYNPEKETPLPSHVIDNAKNHVGYVEKASNKEEYLYTSNKGKNNYTKFGRWIGCDGDYWCASFISFMFFRSFGYKQGKEVLGSYSPSCETLRKNMTTSSTPKVGDIVFFSGSRHSGANHVGLVYKVDDTYIYTIEGNTSDSNEVNDNGGAVCKKKYKKSYDRIICYGHPKYAKQYTGSLPTTYPSKGYFYNGCPKSGDVKEVQKFLVWYFGDNCEIVPNGVYRDLTEGYVKEYQKDMGIPVNGKWGRKCYAKAKKCYKYKGKVICIE